MVVLSESQYALRRLFVVAAVGRCLVPYEFEVLKRAFQRCDSFGPPAQPLDACSSVLQAASLRKTSVCPRSNLTTGIKAE